MSEKRSENENSNDFIYNIEEFDSLLDNMNKRTNINEMNQSIDEEKISLDNPSFQENYSLEKSSRNFPFFILYRISDTLVIILLFVIGISFFIGMAVFILSISVSLYSIILMCYIFFISSIISYTMAPIYDCFSCNWLNFAFSFTQVILASPLVAFYIYYIVKSVISFADYFINTPKRIKYIFFVTSHQLKSELIYFFRSLFRPNYVLIFNCALLKYVFLLLGCSMILLVLSCFPVYATFFVKYTVIVFGLVLYIQNIIGIFGILSCSYVYFFQTLFNIKSKELRYVYHLMTKFGYKSCSNNLLDDYDKRLMNNVQLDINNNNPNEKNNLKFNILEDEKTLDNSSVSEITNETEEKALDDSSVSEITNENKEKLFEDSSISEFKDESEEALNECKNLQNLFNFMHAQEYLPLYYYSTSIACDRHRQFHKKMCMIIFFILNLVVISYDIYQLVQDYSDYLLASIIIRFILIPLFSFYNIVTVLFHKAKDKTLRIINFVSIIFTCIVIVVIIFGYSYSSIYGSKYRIASLDYVPPLNNNTIANEELINHPVCGINIFNNSAFDAFGYALGGYDIKRNKTIFDNQMKTFFGDNYSSHINYTLHEIDKNFLFIQYFDSITNSHIFAFRGYNSGPEIAFQFELFVSYYIIPFFEDNVPFYELINDNWLSFYTNFLNSFGLRFFENRNLIVNYVKQIIEIYNKKNLKDEENVFFTGINCGGVIAKIVGTLLHRRSISFISFPMDMNFLEHLFHYSSTYISYVTNVFNIDGFFSHPDSDHAINIGIDTPVFIKSIFCSSDFCDLFSKTDNIYRSFCTMTELCGKGNQFNYYCKNTIGEKDLDIIREFLQDSD